MFESVTAVETVILKLVCVLAGTRSLVISQFKGNPKSRALLDKKRNDRACVKELDSDKCFLEYSGHCNGSAVYFL